MTFVMKQERNNLCGRRMHGSGDFIEQKHGTLMKEIMLEGYAERKRGRDEK